MKQEQREMLLCDLYDVSIDLCAMLDELNINPRRSKPTDEETLNKILSHPFFDAVYTEMQSVVNLVNEYKDLKEEK
ncbi:hypothetical protein ACFQZ1_10870 [Bacillus sp. CGMCC 1.60114]|uniref:hypothetical protein n=1 Tax=unclassified Bacillus (in: firmicutes) TaxID=185979 RepID=UPI00362A56AF